MTAVACNCGKTRLDLSGSKAVVTAEDTTAVVTIVNNGSVKIEHLECQSCRTVTLLPSS
jgi:hypothetical protein